MFKSIHFLNLFFATAYLMPTRVLGLTIHGKIHNTQHFVYRVSLFPLRSIDQFNWLREDNLAAYGFTDSSGTFTIKADFLPVGHVLYRLHIRKIEFGRDSVSDLIDGTRC
jgi:hypothetical protein